jgi:hypothetical protein
MAPVLLYHKLSTFGVQDAFQRRDAAAQNTPHFPIRDACGAEPWSDDGVTPPNSHNSDRSRRQTHNFSQRFRIHPERHTNHTTWRPLQVRSLLAITGLWLTQYADKFQEVMGSVSGAAPTGAYSGKCVDATTRCGTNVLTEG